MASSCRLRVFLRSRVVRTKRRQQNPLMATASGDLASIEEAIYDQSFRILDEQARVLEGLRARAGTLVGAATVTTASALSEMGRRPPSSAASERVRRRRANCVALAFSTDDRVLQREELRRESSSTDALVGTVSRGYGALRGRSRPLALDACDMKWPIRIRKRPKPQWPEPRPPRFPDTSVSERGGPPKR